jgi:hypothetical protein
MSISARMHFFPPFAGHASFRELSKLWQEVFFKLDLDWLARPLLSTLIKLPDVYLKIFFKVYQIDQILAQIKFDQVLAIKQQEKTIIHTLAI